jgi:hypothetical protein
MHAIRPRKEFQGPNSLPALTGVLNSDWAARWFWREAKHRGVALDISGTVLGRFPLPKDNPEAESALAALVRTRQALRGDSLEIRDLEAEIEELVRKWYEGRAFGV